MALYEDLPIYQHGCALLALGLEVEAQLPRKFKRRLGDGINQLCMQMLEDMAMANASRGQARLDCIDQLLTHLRAVTALLRVGHSLRAPHPAISTTLWARSIDLLGDIGRQAGGWRKQTIATLQSAPAA